MKHAMKILGITVCALLAMSCVSMFSTGPLSPANVRSTDVVLVGRVDILPEIQIEQFGGDIKRKGLEDLPVSNRVVLNFLTTGSEELAKGTLKSAFGAGAGQAAKTTFFDNAIQGEFFITKVTRGQFMALSGFFVEPYGPDFPTVFSINAPDDARAVYIGNLEFSRDKFYRITDFKMKDDYDNAKEAFLKQFPGWELVRADISPLKSE